MFDTLFQYPCVLARHRDGPLAQERECFLIDCASAGATRQTLLRLASELLLVARQIDLSDDRPIDLREVEAACERWVRHQRRHRRIRDPRFCRQRFVQTATQWLRFLGRLEQPPEKAPAFTHLVDEFADYMRNERGLSPCTIHSQHRRQGTKASYLSAVASDRRRAIGTGRPATGAGARVPQPLRRADDTLRRACARGTHGAPGAN
jgi:integrase/recombinase XerD